MTAQVPSGPASPEPPLPPKPAARAGRIGLWRYLRLFRQDILSAQPAHLYRAWMAEFRAPFLRSYLCNDPALIDTVLRDRPRDFPKSERVRAGLEPMLGQSVFLTNGAEWAAQRRIIDPAFAGGRLGDTYPAMVAAGRAAVARLATVAGQGGTHGGNVAVEAAMSHLAADVIFRTLFSIPIEDRVAAEVHARFRRWQEAQPLLNLAAFLPLPRWMPRFHRRSTVHAAETIRHLIRRLTDARAASIAAGTAPDDLATKIMTTRDPETGQCLDAAGMVDQVAIFFLAGHETSAAALAWALYLLATHPGWQNRVAQEAQAVLGPAHGNGTAATAMSGTADAARLRIATDVFRETLRLYPPVPMMVREAACPERFRDRDVPRGAQIVLSPWHLHRHERLWDRPDAFDPARWSDPAGRASARQAYLPFSAGPRVCPGAGFAMLEGPLLLAMLVRDFEFCPLPADVPGAVPVPVARITTRARAEIRLQVLHRSITSAT
jgi:cytochrome P450